MFEDVAISGQCRAQRAVCLCELEVVEGRMHVLRRLDAGVVAVQGLADSATQPVHGRNRESA